MNADTARIARRARRLGWTAQELADQTDSEWDRFRVVAECDDASDSDLGEVVDTLLRWEESEAQFGTVEMVDNATRGE